jgi:hypothetical protein
MIFSSLPVTFARSVPEELCIQDRRILCWEQGLHECNVDPGIDHGGLTACGAVREVPSHCAGSERSSRTQYPSGSRGGIEHVPGETSAGQADIQLRCLHGRMASLLLRHIVAPLVSGTSRAIGQCEWARASYLMQRDLGKKHHAAVRALAYKWIRIIFRCWRTVSHTTTQHT